MNQKLQYLNILIFIIVTFIVILVLCLVSFFLKQNVKLNRERLINYESGCLPTSDNIDNIKIHFFVIGIIFLILDIEIVLLFPWVIGLKQLGLLGFYKSLFLWFILVIGYLYEWVHGSLEWIKS